MGLTILKSLKQPVSIRAMIHKKLAGYEKPRSSANLHASDLMKELEFCPREHALLRMGVAKKKPEYVGTALRMTYDHGRDLELRIRDQYLQEEVSGYWKCGVCSHLHEHFGKRPKVNCPKCHCGYQWKYLEPRFVSSLSGVSGGIDALVDVGEPKLRILEIKSIKDDEFKKLVAPLAEHRWRTALYMRLVAECGTEMADRVNTAVAHILYATKGFGTKEAFAGLPELGVKDSPFSPFKEFLVSRDDSLSDIQSNKAKALTYWAANPSGGLPTGICVNGLAQRAQKCSACTPCWSGKFPATLTWLEKGVSRHPGKKVIDTLCV